LKIIVIYLSETPYLQIPHYLSTLITLDHFSYYDYGSLIFYNPFSMSTPMYHYLMMSLVIDNHLAPKLCCYFYCFSFG